MLNYVVNVMCILTWSVVSGHMVHVEHTGPHKISTLRPCQWSHATCRTFLCVLMSERSDVSQGALTNDLGRRCTRILPITLSVLLLNTLLIDSHEA